ncbi:universal stress protein [Aliiroseovarius lamellibrachiae]|uniref:universal stress protein n=1 Tax=Aliiroseovarius lamellibrachiae TaxID=1924933 RepID=UPI001BDF8BDA|nr:universal stress protein [Aliiroseovarius lamellibrachiae]MBT2132459.1 universal stress protein [Aliiroseovarius lamellibrachiae]
MAKKILLTIDHTDDRSWKKALPYALEQAKFYGAELHVVEVVPEIIKLPNLPEGYGSGAKEYVRGKVNAILAAGGAADVTVHIPEGSVYREILKLAHKSGVDLIIIASNKGEFPNYEIGPNLARVVRNAHCTVTVVRD